MTDTVFTPIWITPPGKLADIREGDTVSVALATEEYCRLDERVGISLLSVGDAVTRVTAMKLNGLDSPFTVNLIDEFVLFAPLTLESVIELYATSSATYSLLNGSLPPGLSLDPTGVIRGTVGNIVDGPITFDCTIRATNGVRTRDRAFKFVATGVDHPAILNVATMPPESTDPALHLTYRSLGEYERADPVGYTLDLLDEDNLLPALEIHHVTGLPDDGVTFGYLPPGISFTGGAFVGVIESNAPPGRYFFELRMIDPVVPQSVIFEITVLEALDPHLVAGTRLAWTTPIGSLGRASELEECYFSISATVNGGPAPLYSLSPISGPLPETIALDPTSGLLTGTLPPAARETTYDFIGRAMSGHVIIDRPFSFTVAPRYNSDDIYSISFRMRTLDAVNFIQGYVDIIDPSVLFRPADPVFGLMTSPTAYLIKGLDGSKSLLAAMSGDGTVAVMNPDYHGPISLILGTHRSAVARNSNGAIAYEVIYRDLFDPNATAGGFVAGMNTPVEEKVQYPELLPTSPEAHYVHPVSLRNMRYDLVQDIGFATDDPNLKYVLGPGGVEGLPLWMRSVQADGTVRGFTPALVVAYVQPGTAANVLKKIAGAVDAVPNNGRVYVFDKYFYTGHDSIGHIQL